MDDIISNKTNDTYLKTPLFSIMNSKVSFYFKREELHFDFNLISNVQIIENRVFFINYIFAFTGFTFFYFVKNKFNIYLSPIYFSVVFLGIIYFSFLYKQFSYKLLINNENLVFHELKVSSQNINHAQYFMTLYKKQQRLSI